MTSPPEVRRPPTPPEGGFTLVEVMVAVVLLALGLFGLIHAMVSAWRLEQVARERRIALTFAVAQIERLRSLPFASLSTAPPEGYLVGSTWPSSTGFRRDLDNNGSVDLFGRHFSARAGATYAGVTPGISLHDPLLLGLRERPGLTWAGEVVFRDPDAASGLSKGDGYWVTVRVLWVGAAGDGKLEISSFVTRRL